MRLREGRAIEIGQRVKVYRNLQKNCFSIADDKTGLVLGYADSLVLTNCTFKVNQGGRNRVLETKRKNVHAYIHGTLESLEFPSSSDANIQIIYNPYKTESFVLKDNFMPIHKSCFAYLENGRIWTKKESS